LIAALAGVLLSVRAEASGRTSGFTKALAALSGLPVVRIQDL
jgi:hypothetical protein